MARRTVKRLKKGWTAAVKRAVNWESSWRDGYRFAMPQRDIMDQPKPGQPKGSTVMDSTAINSTAAFVNRIQLAMFPPFQDFIRLEPGPALQGDENVLAQARKKLDAISKMFHALIHRSNFKIVINEMLYDLAIGTGVMMMLEGDDDSPFRFISVALPLVRLEPAAWGGVGAIYRQHKLTLDVIKEQWPEATIPDDWEASAKEDDSVEFKLFEATYREEPKGVLYYDLWRDEDENHLLPEPRIYSGVGPWITVRWVRASNEVYGRGPLMFALPDIRTINRTKELILKNASLTVAPIYTGTNDGVFNPNTARFRPGSVIPVARNQGHPMGASLVPLERAGDFNVGQLVVQDLQVSIKQMLFDKALPPEAGQPRTATEIVERIKELAMNTGPAFGRLMDELIVPVVMRGLEIMERKGLIDFPVKIDGTTVKVEVTSPLAQEQNLEDIQNVVNWWQLSAMIRPEIAMLGIKVEDLPQWFGAKLGVDQELARDPQEKSGLQQMVAGIIAQQQNPEGAAPGAEGQQGPAAPPPGALDESVLPTGALLN